MYNQTIVKKYSIFLTPRSIALQVIDHYPPRSSEIIIQSIIHSVNTVYFTISVYTILARRKHNEKANYYVIVVCCRNIGIYLYLYLSKQNIINTTSETEKDNVEHEEACKSLSFRDYSCQGYNPE